MDNEIFSSGWLENVVWQRDEKSYTATKGHSWQDFPIYQLSSFLRKEKKEEKKSSLATAPWGSCSSLRPALDWNWPAFINRLKACTILCVFPPMQLIHFAYSVSSVLLAAVFLLCDISAFRVKFPPMHSCTYMLKIVFYKNLNGATET